MLQERCGAGGGRGEAPGRVAVPGVGGVAAALQHAGTPQGAHPVATSKASVPSAAFDDVLQSWTLPCQNLHVNAAYAHPGGHQPEIRAFDICTQGAGDRQAGDDVSAVLTAWGSWQPALDPHRRPSVGEALVGSLGGRRADQQVPSPLG